MEQFKFNKHISLITSRSWPASWPSGNRASWASHPQKSATLLPCPGGTTTKSTRTCGGTGRRRRKEKKEKKTSRSKHIYKIMTIFLILDETCAACHIILRVQDIKDRYLIKFIGHSDLPEKWPRWKHANTKLSCNYVFTYWRRKGQRR